jgi:hypothetical protein
MFSEILENVMKTSFKVLLVTCIFGLIQHMAWSNTSDEAKDLCDKKFKDKIHQFDNLDLKKFFLESAIKFDDSLTFDNSLALDSLISDFNRSFIKSFQEELNITPVAPLSTEKLLKSLEVIKLNNGQEKLILNKFEEKLNIPELANEEGVNLVFSIKYKVDNLFYSHRLEDKASYKLIKEFGTYLENESFISVSERDFLGRPVNKVLACNYNAYQDTDLLNRDLSILISVKNTLTGYTVLDREYNFEVTGPRSNNMIRIIFESFLL